MRRQSISTSRRGVSSLAPYQYVPHIRCTTNADARSQTAWLSKHRRDWYKHHLRINYSSRTATFSSDPREALQRRLSGQEGPSSSALFQHSFPQPDELDSDDYEDASDAEAGAANGAALATSSTPPALQVPRASSQKGDVTIGNEDEEFVDAPSEPEDLDENPVYSDAESDFDADNVQKTRRSSTKSFVTASSERLPADEDDDPDEAFNDCDEGGEQSQAQASGLNVPSEQEQNGQKSLGKRPVSNVESYNAASTLGGTSADAGSTSSLLRKADVNKAPARADVDARPPSKGIMSRVKRRSDMGLSTSNPPNGSGDGLTRKKSNLRNLVKFDLPEDSKRAKVHLKAKQAQMTISRAPTKLRRQKLRDGLVVKMERMLVRVDAASEVPDDFDENVNQRVASRVKDKWREYMVVCRHSQTDNADFVLQFYQTRVSFFYRPYMDLLLTLLGHPRNREARRWEEGRIRNTTRAQDEQNQYVLLAGQVDGGLDARQALWQSDLHHAGSHSFERGGVVHFSA